MADIKSTAEIAEKWAGVTPSRAGEYEKGILNTPKDWAANTAAAEGRYQAGVQAAIAKKRFGKGVRKAGTEKWRKNASEKGPARWQDGVSRGAEAYANGFEPYRQVIAGLTLPERGPAGDPKNYDRVRIVGDALHKKKVSG